MFKGLLLSKTDGNFEAQVCDLDEKSLPNADIRVAVSYSTLNYKDALAITNKSPIVRNWPLVAGIDGVGVVQSSASQRFRAGAKVIHTGWGVGESWWGCLAEKASLKGEWLVALPDGLSERHAMGIGTAGLTAMLCAQALRKQGVAPKDGPILVTGAAGGVGSIAILILSGWGYDVVASTGRTSESNYLKGLGAVEILDRAILSDPGKPLQKERWAGVVDSVGSHTLANACASTRYGGVVTACGLAQGMDFPATVAPFILRGVKLVGIDSVMAPLDAREQAWKALAEDVNKTKLDIVIEEVPLDRAIQMAPEVLAGKVRGRLVVRIA